MRWWWAAALLVVVAGDAAADTFKDPSGTVSIDLDTSHACFIFPRDRVNPARCKAVDATLAGLPFMNVHGPELEVLVAEARPITPTDWQLLTVHLQRSDGKDTALDEDRVRAMARDIREPIASTAGLVVGPETISKIEHDDGIDRATITFDVQGTVDNVTRDMRATYYVLAGGDMLLVASIVPVSSAEPADAAIRAALATVKMPPRSSARAWKVGELTTVSDSARSFSLQLNTDGACVLAPPELRTDAACATRPAPKILGDDIDRVFEASMPLPSGARYSLTIAVARSSASDPLPTLTEAEAKRYAAFLASGLEAQPRTTLFGPPTVSAVVESRGTTGVSVAVDAHDATTNTDQRCGVWLYQSGARVIIQTCEIATDHAAVEGVIGNMISSLVIAPPAPERKPDSPSRARLIGELTAPAILGGVVLFALFRNLRSDLKPKKKRKRRKRDV